MRHLLSLGRLACLTAAWTAAIPDAVSNTRVLPPCTGSQVTQWDGCTGQQISEAGWVYEGVFRTGIIVSGTLVYPDRRFYIGELREGLPHGEGRFYDQQGDLLGIGRWEKGKLSHEEKGVSSILTLCPGDPRRSFIACFGVERFPDGSYYSGEWLNGRWNGLGVSGSDSGRWENGVLRERINLRNEFFPINGIRPSTSTTPPMHLQALAASPALGKQQSQTDSTAGDKLTIESAKKKCAEIGFKTGTEAYGRCVLQLSK